MKKKLIFAFFAVLLAAFISCDPDGKEKEEEESLELPQFLQNTVWVTGEPADDMYEYNFQRDIIRFGVDTVTIHECMRKTDRVFYLFPETFTVKKIESLPYVNNGLYIAFTDNPSEFIHIHDDFLYSAFHGRIARVGDWHKVGNDMYFYEELEDKTYQISAFLGSPDQTNFVLPNLHLGKNVTRIGRFAFCPNKELSISRLTIPDSVKYIDYGAFHAFESILREITIGGNVEIVTQDIYDENFRGFRDHYTFYTYASFSPKQAGTYDYGEEYTNGGWRIRIRE